jgi:uncharacterized protein
MRAALLIALAALAASAAPAAAQTAVDTTPTITADGLGTVMLAPDLANFTAGVDRVAPTSAGARNSANGRIAAVRRAAVAHGVAIADIQTAGLSIARERVGRKGHRRVRYHAQQSLRITARSIPGLGALLDAVATAGADEVSDPDFGFADPSQGRLLATRTALADARRRADDAAAQTGMRITGVRSIVLDPEDSAGASGGGSADSAAPTTKTAVPTHVDPGTEEFDEQVQVIYTAAAAA